MERRGTPPYLLFELTSGGDVGGLAGHVALAGGDLEERGAGRDPPLAHHHDVVLVVDRHHDDRAGMVHDMTFQGLACGRGHRETRAREETRLAEDGGVDDLEVGRGGHTLAAAS